MACADSCTLSARCYAGCFPQTHLVAVSTRTGSVTLFQAHWQAYARPPVRAAPGSTKRNARVSANNGPTLSRAGRETKEKRAHTRTIADDGPGCQPLNVRHVVAEEEVVPVGETGRDETRVCGAGVAQSHRGGDRASSLKYTHAFGAHRTLSIQQTSWSHLVQRSLSQALAEEGARKEKQCAQM